jgi:ABC-type Mn2+/Zn2+ transport system permease subunit
MLDLFLYPFMQRAFLAGAMIAAVLACLGVFVTLRRMAFFGDGVAHASLAGIAIALLAGVSPLPIAMVWAVGIAVYIWRLERSTRLPPDTVVGIFFTASMALGVIIMSFTNGYQPDLISYLFGSILSIRNSDVVFIAMVTVSILAWVAVTYKQLVLMSLSEETAAVAGVSIAKQTLALYVTLAIATVLGVKILGIVLVSALLILPPATSRLFTKNFKDFFSWSVFVAEIMVLCGLAASYQFDLPSGASIVLVGTIIFFLVAWLKRRR